MDFLIDNLKKEVESFPCHLFYRAGPLPTPPPPARDVLELYGATSKSAEF